MYIQKELTFEAAHRLRFHQGACRNLHGHSYRCRVTVEANPLSLVERAVESPGDPQTGMVVDFGVLSSAMRALLITGEKQVPAGTMHLTPWDHAIIVSEEDPLAEAILTAGVNDERIGALRMVVLKTEPTAENMATRIAMEMIDRLPDNLRVVRVELWETVTSCAVWEGPR